MSFWETDFSVSKCKKNPPTPLVSGDFVLLFFLVNGMLSCDGVELFKFKFFISVLLFILSGVVGVTFPNAFSVSHRNQFYEFIL